MQLYDILDPLLDTLTVGAIMRLALTCTDFVFAIMKSGIISSKLKVKMANEARLTTLMSNPQRCRECGKYRSIRTRRLLNCCPTCNTLLSVEHDGHTRCRNNCMRTGFIDVRVCLQCAMDTKGFRFHPNREQCYAIIKAQCGYNGFIPKKRIIDRLIPKMLTQTRMYLYSIHDVYDFVRLNRRDDGLQGRF